ncbi:MAG: hypothetical protein ABR540_13520 [Acidimicrobiales bacterium]|nr:hypothetical protein [Chloroflexota bacterium]
MSRKSFAIRFLGTAAVALVVASSAWACVPFPIITVEPQSSGFAGQEVTVKGIDLGLGMVEVRWNTMDGPRLATAPGPTFTAQIKIPDAPSGLYTVVLLTRAEDDSVTVKASTQFEIVGPSSGGAATPASTARPADKDSSRGPGVVLLAVGGLVLLALGVLLGTRVRRRDRANAPA